MSLQEFKNYTQEQIAEERRKMLDPVFQLGLRRLPEKEQLESYQKLLDLEVAHNTLCAKKFEEIETQLKANERELKNGIKSLGNALEDLTQVKTIITQVTGLLKFVERVIQLV